MNDTWLAFEDVIKKVGINPCVAVPSNIIQQLDKKGFIPVQLDLEGSKHLANLVPLGTGKYRLYINGIMLKSTGWKVGDSAKIKLRYDPKPRQEPIPKELLAALENHPKAKKIFEAYSPSRKKEVSRYLNNLKSAEAIDRNIAKIIKAMEGDASHMLIRK